MSAITYTHNTGSRLEKYRDTILAVLKVALLFLLFFAITFTALNFGAIAFQAKYRLNKEQGAAGGEYAPKNDVIHQLTIPDEVYYEGEDRLIIPKINIEAPLVYADTFDEKKIQEYLRQGIVHYVDTAKPGQAGNTVVVGHSSTYQWDDNSYGRIFVLLNELEPGDPIFFIANNRRYRYVVTEKFIIKANQVEVLSQDGFDKPTVTLMSCWPIGTYWKRLVVRGELQQL